MNLDIGIYPQNHHHKYKVIDIAITSKSFFVPLCVCVCKDT